MLEWNGRSLQGKTYEEVYDIIAESKQEPQVELIVSRMTQKIPLATNPTPLLKEDVLIPGNRIGRRHTDVANLGQQPSVNYGEYSFFATLLICFLLLQTKASS